MIAECLMPGVLAGFNARHPQVRLRVFVAGSDEIAGRVAGHTVAVGLTEAAARQPGLSSDICRDDEFALIRAHAANGYEILTTPAQFETVHKALEAKDIKCEVAEVTELPLTTVPLPDAQAAAAVNKLIEALEEHDDVKEVHSNAASSD